MTYVEYLQQMVSFDQEETRLRWAGNYSAAEEIRSKRDRLKSKASDMFRTDGWENERKNGRKQN